MASPPNRAASVPYPIPRQAISAALRADLGRAPDRARPRISATGNTRCLRYERNAPFRPQPMGSLATKVARRQNRRLLRRKSFHFCFIFFHDYATLCSFTETDLQANSPKPRSAKLQRRSGWPFPILDCYGGCGDRVKRREFICGDRSCGGVAACCTAIVPHAGRGIFVW